MEDRPANFSFAKLFASTFSLSAFTFGGGYVIVPLMKKRFVDELAWIEEAEMLEFVAIAQSSPGAMAINCAVLAGYRVAGLFGGICSMLGATLPPLIVLSLVSTFYYFLRDNYIVAAVLRAMQAGIAAVIAEVVLGLASSQTGSAVSVVTMLLAFAAAWFLGINAAVIILVCAVVGATRTLMGRRTPGDLGEKSGENDVPGED